ncbi:hypothetical protein E2C01_044559 [Portunus trituberculatus]|uniref:Uncharacterized protein n=1 Tax=Portunus trituberculatus TaxID=210409 RepID=A0A5B7FZN9_PORTR|nr:hypothetical protein [Portunus trituberculatus]
MTKVQVDSMQGIHNPQSQSEEVQSYSSSLTSFPLEWHCAALSDPILCTLNGETYYSGVKTSTVECRETLTVFITLKKKKKSLNAVRHHSSVWSAEEEGRGKGDDAQAEWFS